MVQTAKQMLDKKIIVKNLAKIGTFEQVDVICVNKANVLTENKLVATKV